MSKKDTTPDEITRVIKDGTALRTYVFMKKVWPNGKGNPYLVLTEDGIKFIERLYACNCSTKEVAAELGVSVDALNNKFNKEVNRLARERGQERFKSEIRQEQRKILKRGDSRMAIWLGKQYLGQTDKIEASVTVEEKSADELTWEDLEEMVRKSKK